MTYREDTPAKTARNRLIGYYYACGKVDEDTGPPFGCHDVAEDFAERFVTSRETGGVSVQALWRDYARELQLFV